MKFTHRWLLQHIDTDLSPQAIGDKLTQAGLELEGLTDLSRGLEHVQTGLLLEVSPHPDADRLTLCQVQVGDETLSIVCGATNHRRGDTVAVARIGATLANGLTIKKSRIRGQLSEGMLCSTEELGLSGPTHGILIISPETKHGLPLAEVLGRNDTVLELGLTPNRGDCLGVRGIARELAALTQTVLRPLPSLSFHITEPATALHIDDGVGCPRYAGRIIRNVRLAPSPDWLRIRLESVGLRCINNVVDITNFILWDLNQPLHAFDLARLELPIRVRRAHPGEILRTLDGVERILDEEMTVIADQQQALALAGIMGGESSGVTAQTTDILLESAYFDPIRTARTGRRLGINSDARYRFERGTDPEAIGFALDLATDWILRLAGGHASEVTLVDAGSWSPLPPVAVRPKRMNALGSINLSPTEMEHLLKPLGCQKVGDEGESMLFQPPSHRHDLRREEDFLEEIVRLYGYDRIPSSLPRLTVNAAEVTPLERTTEAMRRILSGRGYLEAINYAFVSAELQQRFDPALQAIALLNPISTDQAVMRTNLVAGLAENAQRNLSRGNQQLRLFEVGRVFVPDSSNPAVVREPHRLAGLLSGFLSTRNWHTAPREVDFFDLKGDMEALLQGLGWSGVRFETGGPDFLHPGRKAIILAGKSSTLGWIGQLHPSMQEALHLPQTVHCFELEAVFLENSAQATVRTPWVSRFPSVERDLAFVVDVTLSARQFLDAIGLVNPRLIQATTLFDVYTGQHVPTGKKSLALGVLLQAEDRTLTDLEAQEVTDRIIAQMAQQFGATLRS